MVYEAIVVLVGEVLGDTDTLLLQFDSIYS